MKKPKYVTDKNLKTFIKNALEEDIQDGDHSTLSTIPKDLIQRAQLLVKESCILAGVEMAQLIFKTFDKNLEIETFINERTFYTFYRAFGFKLYAKNERYCDINPRLGFQINWYKN
jgi:hypothetical protein